MAKLILAAAFVAALVVAATAKPLSVNDPTPITCMECTFLGKIVEVFRKQGQTKDQIDQKVQAVCSRLPMSLKAMCMSAFQTQFDPLLDALDKNNGMVNLACQSIGKCASVSMGTSLPDCAACEVEAAFLKKALKVTSAEKLADDLDMLCERLPEIFEGKCEDVVEHHLKPLLDEFAKNPSETSPQACQALTRCVAPSSALEELVQKVISAPTTNPLDCVVCSLEAVLLKKMLETSNKAQIDANMTALCNKLPAPLVQKCLDGLNTQINPIIDELTKNENDTPKQACQAVARCASSTEEDLEELVQSITTVDRCTGRGCQVGASPIECLVCSIEATLVKKLLETSSKAQIDANITALCNKLPAPLVQKCLDGLNTLIDPLIDELTKNQNDTPKQACLAIGKCSASIDEDLEQVVKSVTAVERPCHTRNCGPALETSPVDCIVCGVEAAIMSKVLQNNTKADIDNKLAEICAKLPDQLRVKCNQAVTQKIDPIIDELVKNPNENPKQVCQAVGRCQASNDLEQIVEKITAPTANPLDCLACALEAAMLEKVLKNNTQNQIVSNLTALCNKLPAQLVQKCLDGVNNQIVPLLNELAKNPNDSPKQACQAVGRCQASSGLEKIVEKITSPNASPLDCLACGIEAAVLEKALQNNTQNQIVSNLTALCNKLPAQLVQKCLDGVNNQIVPLLNELAKNPNDSPKQACQAVGRCDAASIDEQLEELVQSVTTVNHCTGRGCNLEDSPIDCIVCAVEAAILSKVLQNNTKADIDNKLAEICAKLPDQLRVKCNQAVTQKIDPIIDELAKNPNENPKQVCQAVGRCQAEEEDFDELAAVVAPTIVDPKPGVDCAMCGLESAILAKKLNSGKKKAQIDDKLTILCNKLPKSLRPTCLADIKNKIDPLIDGLTANDNDPKKACQTVGRCP